MGSTLTGEGKALRPSRTLLASPPIMQKNREAEVRDGLKLLPFAPLPLFIGSNLLVSQPEWPESAAVLAPIFFLLWLCPFRSSLRIVGPRRDPGEVRSRQISNCHSLSKPDVCARNG